MPKGVYQHKPTQGFQKGNSGNRGKKLNLTADEKRKRGERLTQYVKKHGSWNRGLTKEDPRAAKYAKHFQGKNNPWYGKIKEAHPRWKGGKIKIVCFTCGKEKLIPPSARNRGNRGCFCSSRCFGIWNNKQMPTKDTSIEIAIEQELIKQKIPYLKQCPIEGIALVDFLLPNKIIIQADGDYWHSFQKAKDKDINQDFLLGFKGYKVFRFTETQINKSVKRCINKVIKEHSL